MKTFLFMFLLSAAVFAEEVDEATIARMRAMGPAGLAQIIREHPNATAAIDAVAKQKDASASQLYWYTDFEQAKAAARAAGKPILSLRLLGNLDEEFSCANSRFFRTVLYANADVSAALRDRFVLHWKSVRPVPKVTIDFGDGRTLERTLTGNSIHYILDADGQVIDALPGLYGPKAFRRGLARAEQACLNFRDRPALLAQYHRDRVTAIAGEWAADVAKVGLVAGKTRVPVGSPTAIDASFVTVSKTGVELPMLRAMVEAKNLEVNTDAAAWEKIAHLHAEDAQLDAGSRALMRTKFPSAATAASVATSKMIVEDPLLRAIRTFERSVAEDTVRNEYRLHRQLHEWLANAPARNVEALNDRVYAQLFLTPRSDPWLGLAPAEVFTALPGNGLK